MIRQVLFLIFITVWSGLVALVTTSSIMEKLYKIMFEKITKKELEHREKMLEISKTVIENIKNDLGGNRK